MLLGIGIPACVLFSGSVVLFLRERTVGSLLRLFGAGCLIVVVFTHVFAVNHSELDGASSAPLVVVH
jgi:Na+/phosphate symporter